MIVYLFGATYRASYDTALERELDALLYAELQDIPGFLSFHTYSSQDGEVLGVVRFETREALDAWRDDPVHRSVWKHAPDLYETFWIQNGETYREYAWSRDVGRTGEDMKAKFARSESNLIRPRTERASSEASAG